jgi:uncharacterized protein (DUF305 family)
MERESKRRNLKPVMQHIYQGLLLVLIFAVLIAFASLPAQAESPPPDQVTSEYEIGVMKAMIDHYAASLNNSQFCLERVDHEALKALCAEKRDLQSGELNRLMEYLYEWYKLDYQPQPIQDVPPVARQLTTLSGVDFEVALLKVLNGSWQSVHEKAEDCLQNGYHARLVSTCERFIQIHHVETALLGEWLCEWYGLCSQ